MHKLFNEFGHRYDLHTPPSHYKHDHQLVLELAREHEKRPYRLLDVGCGTGVLLEKVRTAGIEAHGIDISAAMIDVAKRRVPPDALRVLAMQDLDDAARYDMVVSLSWSIHYCEDIVSLHAVLHRMKRALRHGGLLVLQVAHSPNFTGEWFEDKEPGPSGEKDDITLRFRFLHDGPTAGIAEYQYGCLSQAETFSETHLLVGTDAVELAQQLKVLGFVDVEIWDSWRRDPLNSSGIVFLVARNGRNRDSDTR